MKIRKNHIVNVSFAALTIFLLMAQSQPSVAQPTPDQKKQGTILKRFDYRVCTVQFDRVTFVNGGWIGKVKLMQGNTSEAALSCPLVHEYLIGAGNDGWELVACISQRAGVNQDASEDTTQTLFLKRETGSPCK